MVTDMALFLILIALVAKSSGEVLKITSLNYDTMTAGKSIWLKFYAPWCEHCVAMEPDFERLAAEYKFHPIALVAEVDCTNPDSVTLCENFNVPGYPTIYYGDPDFPHEFYGGNDYDSMAEVAKDVITKLPCSITRIEYCSAMEKATINELDSKAMEDLLQMEQDVDKAIVKSQESFEVAATKINEQYDRLVLEHETEVKDIREETNLKWILQVISYKELQAKEGGEL